jgi:cytochrome c
MSRRGAEAATMALVLCVAACTGGASSRDDVTGEGATRVVAQGGSQAAASVHAPPRRYEGIGRAPTTAEIRAWDIDVNPSGIGLPAGRGTYARGAEVYRQRCAACHGTNGEGMSTNPRLVGREPADFSFARVGPAAPRTIGNYWPYATTLFDYINRAMPFDAPGSLPAQDVYSVVAFLLARNAIIDSTTVVDARSLPTVVMPARDHFVKDDRAGGTTFR